MHQSITDSAHRARVLVPFVLHSMRQLRRVTALLSALFLAQLALVGPGAQRAVIGVRDAHAGHGSGQSHAGMVMASEDHGPDEDAACAGCDPTSSHAPCGIPWMPGGCVSMTACASVMIVGAAALAMDATNTSASASVFLATAPAGPVRAPELPPPRA